MVSGILPQFQIMWNENVHSAMQNRVYKRKEIKPNKTTDEKEASIPEVSFFLKKTVKSINCRV